VTSLFFALVLLVNSDSLHSVHVAKFVITIVNTKRLRLEIMLYLMCGIHVKQHTVTFRIVYFLTMSLNLTTCK